MITLLFCVASVNIIPSGTAQKCTPVNGMVTQGTTLTNANNLSGSMTIMIADNQSLPTPDIPEFTVRLVNNSYGTQPTTTTTTDTYTGKQTTVTTPSQYVKDEYIEVSVKNQLFTPYSINYHNVDSRPVNLYFEVIAQGYFTTDRSLLNESQSQIEDYNSQYTNFTLFRNEVPCPAQIDFKTRAIIGYLVNQYQPEEHLPPPAIHDPNFVITGATSSWSNPQTLAIPASIASQTSTVPELPAIALLSLFASVSVAIAFKLKKTKR